MQAPKRKQSKKTKFGQKKTLKKKLGNQWIFWGAVRNFWAGRKIM